MIKIYDKPLSVILLYGTLLHAAIWLGGSHLIEFLVQWYVGWTISLTLGPVWHALIMTTLIIATAFIGYIEEKEQAATPTPETPTSQAVPVDPSNINPNHARATAEIIEGRIVIGSRVDTPQHNT